VSPSELQAFASEALFDQKMAALSVEAGEKLSFQTAIQLGAEAEAIYMLTGLEGRGLDLIEQHRALWKSTLDFYETAVSIWKPVSADGELLRAHRQLLAQLCELARDRVEFYSVSAAKRREAD
jgi:hypothetical protein